MNIRVRNVDIGFCGPELKRTTHLVHKTGIREKDRTSYEYALEMACSQEVYIIQCALDQDNFEEKGSSRRM